MSPMARSVRLRWCSVAIEIPLSRVTVWALPAAVEDLAGGLEPFGALHTGKPVGRPNPAAGDRQQVRLTLAFPVEQRPQTRPDRPVDLGSRDRKRRRKGPPAATSKRASKSGRPAGGLIPSLSAGQPPWLNPSPPALSCACRRATIHANIDSHSGFPEALHMICTPRADLSTRIVEGEVVILDKRTGRIHQLNSTASFVWNRLDDRTTLAAIASKWCGSSRWKSRLRGLTSPVWRRSWSDWNWFRLPRRSHHLNGVVMLDDTCFQT